MNDETNIHSSAQIDPSAKIARSAQVGAGTIIGPHVELYGGVIIAENCTIRHARLEYGVRVGPRTQINSLTTDDLVTIGEYTTIGADVMIGGQCEIGARVIIEGNARIGYAVSLGNDCIVEMTVSVGDLVRVAENDVVKSCSKLMHRGAMSLGVDNPMVPEGEE